ncbi:MAG: secondary thiamine-phosphate synthase enzyme [Candidatus Anoxymicrobium japonicum]|uniref:Secondary thiamine-phosphate synthase enzyme n=1 Tax=Candidatus Anoxymicrobium japonicum TaxID=2013648 RepID=A0A2N3G640_9ACTN|nr:MAG: secondary thiamine-phosphate synthase enzyme [Candidatus Anoxymicrobium japonicum]
MSVVREGFTVSTRGDADVVDVTSSVSEAVRRSGVHSGIVTIFVPGSTGAVTTIEYEPGLVEDIDEAFDRLAPRELEYHHNQRWHDGNGHSHVRASLMGPSLTVPFTSGKLEIGIWQQIVLVDFDNRPRERDIVCQVLGE